MPLKQNETRDLIEPPDKQTNNKKYMPFSIEKHWMRKRKGNLNTYQTHIEKRLSEKFSEKYNEDFHICQSPGISRELLTVTGKRKLDFKSYIIKAIYLN